MIRGFSLVELLVALAISMLVSAALAAMVPPARAAFEHTPAALDLQQRQRTVVDAVSQVVRSAGIRGFVPAVTLSDADADGAWSAALLAITPRLNGARGVLASDHDGTADALTLEPWPCPQLEDVCGFSRGMTAVVADGAGHFDLMAIASADPASHVVHGKHSLTTAYPAGSIVVQVDAYTLRLDEHADGSRALVRETFAGATQPIVDRVRETWFRLSESRLDVRIVLDGATVRTSLFLRNAS